MISFRAFEQAMTFVIKENEFEEKLYSLINEYHNVIEANFNPHGSIDTIIELLNDVFELPDSNVWGTDLDAWCYGGNYGKDETGIVNWWLSEDHKYYKPEIKTLEELYDYLVWCHDNKGGDTNEKV